MDNAGTPEKPPETTPNVPLPMDDIPVAQREGLEIAPKPQTNLFLLIGSLTALGIAALAAGGFMALRIQRSQTDTLAMESPAPTAEPSQTGSPSAAPNAETLLGHFAYTAAPQTELAPIVADGSIKMRKAAAKAFRDMTAAAQQEGISLVPISGFRSLEDQKYLYFDIKADRNQNATERAKVSAPPGYSEHHTGYAVDIGDGSTPALNLSPDFDKTAAYRWLKENANRYSFEVSFTKNNRQGVSYEPWHWRYVGDIQSLKTFYKARGQK